MERHGGTAPDTTRSVTPSGPDDAWHAPRGVGRAEETGQEEPRRVIGMQVCRDLADTPYSGVLRPQDDSSPP